MIRSATFAAVLAFGLSACATPLDIPPVSAADRAVSDSLTPLAAAPLPPGYVRDAVWTALPGASRLGANYPQRARRLGLGGAAGMECRVEPDGSLVDCRTIDETPPGFGFGAAVLALAPAFRVQTITPAGVDLVGRPVRVGVSFAVGERYGEAARCQALRLASEGRTLERTAAAAAALRRRAPLMAPSLEEAERRLAQHAGRADLLVREQPGSVARLTESCSEPRPRPDFSRAYVTPVQAWIDPDGVAHAVTRPSWARAPSGYEVARYYPDLATRAAVQGRAQLQCRVSTAGELHGCVVADEAPAGWGFGEATLRMSRTLRFKPELIDGEPVETIGNVPITFLLAR